MLCEKLQDYLLLKRLIINAEYIVMIQLGTNESFLDSF